MTTSTTTSEPLVSTSKTAERLAGLLDELAQRLVGRVALDVEAHPDLLVSVANRPSDESQDAEQVDVALDGGVDLGAA